jgi:hypothetical protein
MRFSTTRRFQSYRPYPRKRNGRVWNGSAKIFGIAELFVIRLRKST